MFLIKCFNVSSSARVGKEPFFIHYDPDGLEWSFGSHPVLPVYLVGFQPSLVFAVPGRRILATSTKTLEIQKKGVKKYLPEVRREIEVRREMWMVEYVVRIFCAATASLGCARPKGGSRKRCST